MKVGDSKAVTRRFDTADIADYADLAGLPEVPATVPEPLVAGLVSRLLGVDLPGRGTNYLKQEMCFHAPARADVPLTATVTVTKLRPEKNLADLATACRDESGKLIASGRALVSVRDVADPMEGPGAAGFRFVREAGRGRPIVLLHGWSAHSGFFAKQMALAAKGFRVIAPDLPGHGRDRRPKERLGIADLAAALDAFLTARDLTDVVLVGWSMGATVALDYLDRYGAARVAGFVSVDMTGKIANDAAWRLGLKSGLDARIGERAARLMEADWKAYAPRIAAALFAPGYAGEAASWVKAELAGNDAVPMAALWRDLVAADMRAAASRLDLPALILSGGDSQLYGPAAGFSLADAIAGAERLAIPGAGHSPQIERPDAFNAALAAFAARLPSPQAGTPVSS
jgi:pimeloyl-[acyl-carrier protein] methyl ester esterase